MGLSLCIVIHHEGFSIQRTLICAPFCLSVLDPQKEHLEEENQSAGTSIKWRKKKQTSTAAGETSTNYRTTLEDIRKAIEALNDQRPETTDIIFLFDSTSAFRNTQKRRVDQQSKMVTCQFSFTVTTVKSCMLRCWRENSGASSEQFNIKIIV